MEDLLKKWRNKEKLILILLLLAGLSMLSLRGRGSAESGATYFVPGNPAQVALTFETLWNPSGLDEILAALDAEGIRVTFFLSGSWLKQNPNAARQILASGHEIGNHTLSHQSLLYMSQKEVVHEISEFNKLAGELLEYRPTLFRPPLGHYNGAILKRAKQQGCQTVLWSVDSYDWISDSSEVIHQRIAERLHGGAIVLFRVGAPHLPAALPQIIDELREQGYEAVTVTELLRLND